MQQPIRIYSDNMELLHETDNYLSLQFNPRFYEVGEFELHINQYVEGAEYFQKGNQLVIDKRGDKSMLIRHREVALDQNGKATENWKVTGVTLDGITDQRVTIPPEHTSHDRKSGDAETVMKHYIDRHFVNPDDPDRKIDFIEIAPNQNRGPRIEWESRFKNVADELSSIAKQTNIGWVVYADIERKKWIFDVVEPRDLTQGNEAGNPPVFFSPDFNTIETQQFVDSDSDYKNVGYVGGQGEGAERKIVMIGEGKGISRLETFIDARDVGSEGEEEEEELTEDEVEQMLIVRGEQKMREFSTTFYLEAQILTPSIKHHSEGFSMNTPFEYEKDFRLGDLTDVFNKRWNVTMKAPITEFIEVYEPAGFSLEAIFGEAQPTLISKIKDKFNELDGIEKQELPAKLSVERMREAIDHSDRRLSAEEQARIEQALANLEASKQFASEEAYQAEQEAKRHADYQDILYEEIARDDASKKSSNARADAKQHADDQDIFYEGRAQQDASEKANQAEGNAKNHADQKAGEAEQNAREHADTVADQAERSAKNYTDVNAVNKAVYEAKVQELTEDIAEKAGLEYVDGQLQYKADTSIVNELQTEVSSKVDADWVNGQLVSKADADSVYTISELDSMFDNVVSLTVYEADKDGIITDLESHESRIYQTEQGLGSKVEQTTFNQLADEVGDIGSELNQAKTSIEQNALAIESKAEQSSVNTLTGEVSELESVQRQQADLIADMVTKTEYQVDQDGVITRFENVESVQEQHADMISQRVTQNTLNTAVSDLETLAVEGEKVGRSVPAEGAWYRIATNSGNRASARFLIKDTTSGHHGVVEFSAQTHYNRNEELFITRFSSYGSFPISQIRILTNTTYDTQYLDVYIRSSTRDSYQLTAHMYENIQISGWTLVNFQEDASVPSGYRETVINVSAANSVAGRLVSAETEIVQNADAINLRATTTEVNAVEDRVSTAEGQISTMAGQIELKADSETVTEHGQRLNSVEVDINGLNSQITLKADASTVDNLGEEVSQAWLTIDGLESEISAKADRIELDAFVTAEELEVRGDLKFGGELRGATGTFSGEVRASQLVVDNPNIEQEGGVGLSLQVAQWQPDVNRPFIETGHAEFNTLNDALEIYKVNKSGDRVNLDGFRVYADMIDFTGDTIYVNGGMHLPGTGGYSQNNNGIMFANGHKIGSRNNIHNTHYGNRASGMIPFEIRSHVNGGSFRTDFWIRDDGTMYNNATQDNTSSNQANVRIANDGSGEYRFYRSTSAEKYKTDIQEVNVDPYKLLDLTPKSWYDIAEVEENGGTTEGLSRYYGLIADDFEAVGLPEYVDYMDGEVENYQERAWTLLIPIVKELKSRIDELEDKLTREGESA
ncbi:Gp37-like protein [Evansella clarkii]|uniref:Gp37-like protein n=1 Tax=Evansella clarkii TaxID=79879 RepID=UPI00099666F9|nr:hypothetical protein [Evansella clarkii]